MIVEPITHIPREDYEIPIDDIDDPTLELSDVYIKDGVKVINVLGIEYDISDLTKEQVFLIWSLKQIYKTHSYIKYEMSFEAFVYEQTLDNIIINKLVVLLEPPDDDDDDWIDPYIPSEIEKWWIRFKRKLEELGLSISIIVGIGVVLGVIGLGLVGYQYTQSYVAEKGAEKARD